MNTSVLVLWVSLHSQRRQTDMPRPGGQMTYGLIAPIFLYRLYRASGLVCVCMCTSEARR